MSRWDFERGDDEQLWEFEYNENNDICNFSKVSGSCETAQTTYPACHSVLFSRGTPCATPHPLHFFGLTPPAVPTTPYHF
jgi:hypothetical protein